MTAQPKANTRRDVRRNAAKDLWTRPARPVSYGMDEFRFRLQRDARRLPTVDLDPWVENVTWQRAGAGRTGDIEFRRPLGSHPSSLAAFGDFIVCEWSQWGVGGQQWKTLWRMKVIQPQHQVYEGMITLQLNSRLAALTRSRVAWKFRDDKTHPHGWTAHQITVAVCARFNIPIGHLPKATWRVHRLVRKSASPEDIITWAWTQERRYTGRRFDIDSSTGVVDVTELAEPKYMLILGASMLDATVTQTTGGLASAVTAVSTHKVKGHKKDTKLRVRVVDPDRLKRYGYIVQTLHAPSSIQSTSDLRDWARRRLATRFGNRKHLTFTHPGIPLVDRGTALRLYLPEADIDEVCYVTQAQHDLSAGDYEMDITVGFDDPFTVDKRKARVDRKKYQASLRRNRARRARRAKDAAKSAKATIRSNA